MQKLNRAVVAIITIIFVLTQGALVFATQNLRPAAPAADTPVAKAVGRDIAVNAAATGDLRTWIKVVNDYFEKGFYAIDLYKDGKYAGSIFYKINLRRWFDENIVVRKATNEYTVAVDILDSRVFSSPEELVDYISSRNEEIMASVISYAGWKGGFKSNSASGFDSAKTLDVLSKYIVKSELKAIAATKKVLLVGDSAVTDEFKKFLMEEWGFAEWDEKIGVDIRRNIERIELTELGYLQNEYDLIVRKTAEGKYEFLGKLPSGEFMKETLSTMEAQQTEKLEDLKKQLNGEIEAWLSV